MLLTKENAPILLREVRGLGDTSQLVCISQEGEDPTPKKPENELNISQRFVGASLLSIHWSGPRSSAASFAFS